MATILGGNRRIVRFRAGDAQLESAYESPGIARGVVVSAVPSRTSAATPASRW